MFQAFYHGGFERLAETVPYAWVTVVWYLLLAWHVLVIIRASGCSPDVSGRALAQGRWLP